MGNSTPEQPLIRSQQAPRSVEIVNWPLRDWLGAWLVVAGMGLVAWGAGLVAQSTVMGGLCFVALAISAWRLWIPVTFEFCSRGVIYTVLGRTRQIPWTQIGRYEVRRHGLFFFPDKEPEPLSRLQSMYVRWNGQREAILEVVEFYTQARIPVASTQSFPAHDQEEADA